MMMSSVSIRRCENGDFVAIKGVMGGNVNDVSVRKVKIKTQRN